MSRATAVPQRRSFRVSTVLIGCIILLGTLLGAVHLYQRVWAPSFETKPSLGQIVIIIDDWGYTNDVRSFLKIIRAPFAAAILPKLPYSTSLAQTAFREGKTVMLHLPMEPHRSNDAYPRDYLITETMSVTHIRALINDFLKTVPHASGVNNHMGSKATENTGLMKIVLAHLRAKGLFFVDSVVTGKSVCQNLAQQVDLPFLQRDVFLDNIMTRSAIEKQFAQLAQLAQSQGYAVGIGHARTLTLQIFSEQSRLLSKQGFRFVHIRDLLSKSSQALPRGLRRD